MAEIGTVVREVLFKSADKAKQIVVGVVAEPNTEDYQGDIMDCETIEKMAHGFMADSRFVSNRHYKDSKGKLLPADATVIESFIAPVDYIENGETITKGSWVIATKVHSAKMWHDIEVGEITGFSLGGSGYRTVIE